MTTSRLSSSTLNELAGDRNFAMEMQYSDIGLVRRVVFVGRLDTAGVDRVETRFGAAVVAAGKNTVVDLSQVSFLASLGIRMLITTARSLSRKRAKLAMYGAT